MRAITPVSAVCGLRMKEAERNNYMDLPRLLERYPDADIGAIEVDYKKRVVVFFNVNTIPLRAMRDLELGVHCQIVGVQGPVRESVAVVEFDEEKKET